MKDAQHQHTISVLVENHFGVLTRVAGLFSARGFNIDSLAVGETEDAAVSRMTIVAKGDERVLEQIIKQLEKLIDVIKVVDITNADMIDRELVIVKVRTTIETRTDITQIVNTFRAKILDVKPDSMTVEVTGSESKIDAMIELLKPYKILETVRTGTIALSRNIELRAPGPDDSCCAKKAGMTAKKNCKKTKVSKK